MMNSNSMAMALLLILAASANDVVTAKGGKTGRTLGFFGDTTTPSAEPQMFTSPFDKFGRDFSLVDTNRQARIFHQKPTARDQPGFTYKDHISSLLEGRIDDYKTFGILFGLETGINLDSYLDGSITGSLGFHAAMDSTTKIATSNPNYLETDVTMDELELDFDFLFEQIHCAKTTTRSVTGPDCYDILRLVDGTETIITNPDGEIVGATTFDGLSLSAEELEQLNDVRPTNSNQENNQAPAANTATLQGKFQAQQFAASNHYDKHTDLMKFLPDHPVKPGDEWDDHIDMIDTSGAIFNGKSYLKGYYPCSSVSDDNECAIFTMEGIAHVDEDWLASVLGGGPSGDTAVDTDWLKISDATVYNTFVWDIVDEIPRWAQTNVSLTLTVYDPNVVTTQRPEDRMELSIPVNMTFQFACDIKQKPPGSEIASVGTMALGKSGGKFQWFVLMTFFVVVGGVFYVRKRQGTYNAQSRQFYNGLSNWDATSGGYESSPAAAAVVGSELPLSIS